MTKLFFIFSCMLFVITTKANEVLDLKHLIPAPQRVLKNNINDRFFKVPKGKLPPIYASLETMDDCKTFAESFNALLKRKIQIKSINSANSSSYKYELIWRFSDDKNVTFPEKIKEYYNSHIIVLSKNNIMLGSQTKEGFYYGLQTLLQVILQSEAKNKFIPSATIWDWPDNKKRAIKIDLSTLHKWSKIKEEPFRVFSMLKYNQVYIYLHNSLPGETYNFPKTRPNPLTVAQINDLKRILKKYHLEFNLAFQFGSHFSWLASEPKYKDLVEHGNIPISWNASNWCPSNPLLYKVVGDMLERQIKLCNPKAVLIGHDELHAGNVKTCPLCRKSPLSREELIASGITKIYNIIKKCNPKIDVLAWYDQFLDDKLLALSGANLSSLNGNKIFSLTPKDLQIVLWRYSGDSSIVPLMKYFKKDDRKVYLAPFLSDGAHNNGVYAEELKAEGIIETLWYTVKGIFSNHSISQDAMQAIVCVADSAWNSKVNAFYYERDPVAIYSLLANGAQPSSRKVDFVKLPQQEKLLARSKSQHHSILNKVISRIPRGFLKSRFSNTEFFINSKPLVLAGSKKDNKLLPESITINVNKKAQNIHFLHFCNLTDGSFNFDDVINIAKSVKLGEYRIEAVSSEGKKKTFVIPLKYRWNITDWNNLYSAFLSPTGIILPMDNAIRGAVSEYSHNLSKKDILIKNVTFKSDLKYGLNPVLVAISVGTDSGSVESVKNFKKIHLSDDFEYQSVSALHKKWNFNKNPQLSSEIKVKGQKALLINLRKTSSSRTDVGMNFSSTNFSDANMVSFKLFLEKAPTTTLIPYIYLGNPDKNYFFMKSLGINKNLTGQWQTVKLPLKFFNPTRALKPNEGLNDITQLKLSFWHKNKIPGKIIIDDFKIGFYDGDAIYKKIK